MNNNRWPEAIANCSWRKQLCFCFVRALTAAALAPAAAPVPAVQSNSTALWSLR